MNHHCQNPFFDLPVRAQCNLWGLQKRLLSQLYGKIVLSLRVESKKTPLGVARLSFRITKLLSSRLDWRSFRLNSDDSNGIGRL